MSNDHSFPLAFVHAFASRAPKTKHRKGASRRCAVLVLSAGATYVAKIHLKLIRFNAPLEVAQGKPLARWSTGQLVTWLAWQLALAKQIKPQQNQ